MWDSFNKESKHSLINQEDLQSEWLIFQLLELIFVMTDFYNYNLLAQLPSLQ